MYKLFHIKGKVCMRRVNKLRIIIFVLFISLLIITHENLFIFASQLDGTSNDLSQIEENLVSMENSALQFESQKNEEQATSGYLVSYKSETNIQEFIKSKRSLEGNNKNLKSKKKKTARLELTELEKEQLLSDPNIELIEPDSAVSILDEGIPTKIGDNFTFRKIDGETIPWGNYSIGADIAHGQNLMGDGIKVAILDTGVSNHSDLQIAGGISVVEGVYNYTDDNGHGTHVAGIIGAQKNGSGVVGVAPKALLYSVKVLDSFGNGTYSQVIEGIDWAIENGMNIITISFGGKQDSVILHEAIQRANNAGILVIAAAGNEGEGNETELYPALFGEVLSVGAVNKNFERSIFSSTGAELDLMSPGRDIISTTSDGDYGISSGTSVSAPYVAGASALIWAQNNSLTSSEVRNSLITNATPLGDAFKYGNGIINVAKSLGIVTEPIPPVYYGDESVTETWYPPLFTAGSGDVSIKSYNYQGDGQVIHPGESATVSLVLYEPKKTVWVGVFNPAGDRIDGVNYGNVPAGYDIPFTWHTSSLTPPGVYKIKYAYSGVTNVDWFTIFVVPNSSTGNPPSAPQGLNYSATSDSLTVTWSPVSGADSYIVTLNGAQYTTSNLFYTFNSLASNTSYHIEVAAVNSHGMSSYTMITPDPSTTLINTPQSPTGLSISSFDEDSISFKWNNMGSGIQYVFRTNGGTVTTTTNPSYTLTGLTANTPYAFEVASKNNNVLSEFSSITKRTLFTKPTGINTTNVTDDSITLRWTDIPGARFSIQKNGSYVNTIYDNYYVFDNLEPDKSYTFEIASKNSDGELSGYTNFQENTLPDTVKPTAYFSLSNIAPYFTDTNLSFYVSTFDKNGINNQEVIILKNNVTVDKKNIPASGNSFNYTPNSEGSYSFKLQVQDNYGNITTTTVGPISVVKQKDIIVYVPGFMNTEILNDGDKVWPTQRLPITYNPLSFNSNGTPRYNTQTGEVFEYFNTLMGRLDYGEILLNKLRASNVEIITVPYDWRADLRQAAERVRAAVNEATSNNQGQKITILTHSTGGIVARYYLVTDPLAKDRVKSFINIASPNLGTVRSMKGLVAGDDLDAINYGFLPFSITEAHNMVQNFPSVYQLLPGSKYVNAYNNLHNLNFKSFFLNTDNQNKSKNVTNYQQTKTYLINNHNAAIYEDPESSSSFRYIIENRTLPTEIKEYRIIGYKEEATLIQFIREFTPRTSLNNAGKTEYLGLWGKGDDVISVLSAEFNGVGNATNYYIKGKSHMSLLRPFTYDATNFPTYNIVKSIVVDKNPLNSSNFSRPFVASVMGDAVDINCPVDVVITDQTGNTAYVNEDGFVINNIEGLTYEIIGDSKLLFIADGTTVHLQVSGYDTGDMNIGFTKYGEHGPADQVNVLQHVLINSNTEVSLDFTGGVSNPETTNILYDYNGDGTTQILHVDKALTSAEYYDGQSPSTSHQVTGIENNNYYTSPVTISIQADDVEGSGVEKIYYRVDNSLLFEYLAPFTLTEDGEHEIHYYSIDKAGNLDEERLINVTIDQSAPSEPQITYSLQEWTNDSASFVITPGVDNLSGVQKSQYKIGNDGAWIDYSNEVIIREDGPIQIFARTIDNAGLISESSSVELKIDKSAPVSMHEINGINYNEWYSSDVTVTLSADDSKGIGLDKIFYSLNGQPYSEYSTPFIFDIDGTYSISYYSVDKLGNQENDKQLIINLDMTAPSMPVVLSEQKDYRLVDANIYPEYLVDNTYYYHQNVNTTMFVGSDTGSGVSRVEYSFDPNGTWTTYLQPLLIVVPRTIYARTVDNAGNHSNSYIISADKLYTVTSRERIISISTILHKLNGQLYSIVELYDPEIGQYRTINLFMNDEPTTKAWDLDAPTTPKNLILNNKSNTTITISWDESSDNKGVTGYDIYKNGIYVGSTNTTNYRVSGLNINTVYSFSVKAKDAIGNLSASSDRLRAMTNNDTQLPSTPTQLSIVSKTDSSVTLSWIASTDNIGVISYDIYAGAEIVGTSHTNSYTVDNLKPNTDYIFSVRANDLDNASSFSGTFSVKTLLDYTPPSIPKELKIVGRVDNSIALEWDASTDNDAVSEYTIYQNGIRIGSAGTPFFTVTGIEPNTNYKITITAKDRQGNESDNSVPFNLRNSVNTISVSNHVVYVKADGTVWTWGANGSGQIGDGTTTAKTTAVQVPGMSSVVAVATGMGHTIALKSDGTVWTWGNNVNGQLGTGNTTSRSTPGQVTGLTDIITIAASGASSYAVKNDGTVWAWGSNSNGQLGDGTTTMIQRTSPVQVNNLSGVTAIAAGNSAGYVFAYALKSDGTVWSWGYNNNNQLGIGDSTQRNSPVQVSGATGITAISAGTTHGVALKVDGSVWTWGYNGVELYTTAVQVSGLSGITAIAAGVADSFAVKADGTVWAWGNNTNGQLGDGTTTKRTTPVQVTGLTGVVSVAANADNNNSSALKADGTVWSWGINASGQLGDGTTTQRSIPVRSI